MNIRSQIYAICKPTPSARKTSVFLAFDCGGDINASNSKKTHQEKQTSLLQGFRFSDKGKCQHADRLYTCLKKATAREAVYRTIWAIEYDDGFGIFQGKNESVHLNLETPD